MEELKIKAETSKWDVLLDLNEKIRHESIRIGYCKYKTLL